FTVFSEGQHDFVGFTLTLPPGTYTLEQITDIDGNDAVYETQEVEVVSSLYEKSCPVFQINYAPMELDKTYAVGEYAWIDENSDGIFNEDEEPLSDVLVELYDGNEELIAETTTNQDGLYI